MAVGQFHVNLLLAFYLCSVFSVSVGQNESAKLPLKAVNLGNWLVTEGWIKPSLFSNIPNNDLLDGTQVQLFSTKLQKYLCPENGGGTVVVANRSSASGWETFRLWRINESTFKFRVFNKQFVGLENQGGGTKVVAVSSAPSNPETFQIIRNEGDKNKVRIKASNGLFLQANLETLVTADYNGQGWEDANPSVFKMTILADKTLQGEYQITNGYGPARAPQVMKDHWNTYITEQDFIFMSSNGLNAVRIPVGWWIAHDPNPPKPFIGGSLAALDNAFIWAQKYRMKVIIDLHAPQASQNGNEHSGTRDGYQEWGDSNIQDTVAVIDCYKIQDSRKKVLYANKPSLAAIELMNEPWAPLISLSTLENYYKQGYDAVRKYTQTVYVIMSNRLNTNSDTELLSFAGGFHRVVIDVHYYNLYTNTFKNMNVQQNIDYVNNQRAAELSRVTSSNGPLSFVGEWTAEWDAKDATMQDYQRFAQAQINVYGRATF
ncbi:Glucan 1,3-beta-glucosidase [Quillaja saponaria]|uniref:Glucan 1,3-beta-glucosidase n=1 Tax=Quillaja saponaria TaxID=32244 RepID=A0AAD7KST2_QUISA|nr:Glucan 1,3-beta-glucosidase [Quillaja saponaria]